MMTWPANLFAGRRYAVLGLGRNGLPVARALLAFIEGPEAARLFAARGFKAE